jgi:hypothetical protein
VRGHYPKEVKEEAVHLYKRGGMSLNDLALKYQTNRNRISIWLCDDEEIESYKAEAVELRKDGKSPIEIAALLKDKYFPADYRTVGRWTRGIDKTLDEQHRIRGKAQEVEKMYVSRWLYKWKRSDDLHELINRIESYKALIHTYRMERCA